jgi:hypothetical protein
MSINTFQHNPGGDLGITDSRFKIQEKSEHAAGKTGIRDTGYGIRGTAIAD